MVRDTTAKPGLLGLDVSKRMIGTAGADASWQLATPLASQRRRGLVNDIAALKTILLEREVGVLVIGLPLNMDGSEGPRCQAIRQFGADVDRALDLAILYWDERLTTQAARDHAAVLGLKGHRREARLDAFAAAEILQDCLNAYARLHKK